LLQLQSEEQAIGARNGELKPEVRFVLERYKVEAPEALEDVYLQVRDVMRRGVISKVCKQVKKQELRDYYVAKTKTV
jgi:manganese-dependent inorganic pyrophosphatase